MRFEPRPSATIAQKEQTHRPSRSLCGIFLRSLCSLSRMITFTQFVNRTENSHRQVPIRINGQKSEAVQQFAYLGSVVSADSLTNFMSLDVLKFTFACFTENLGMQLSQYEYQVEIFPRPCFLCAIT